MSALAVRDYVDFNSKLVSVDESWLNIEGYSVLVDFSYHAFKQRKNREIVKAAVTYTIEKAFSHFFGMDNNERFVIIDHEMDYSVVASFYQDGGEMVVSVISVIDTVNPFNGSNTHTIEV